MWRHLPEPAELREQYVYFLPLCWVSPKAFIGARAVNAQALQKEWGRDASCWAEEPFITADEKWNRELSSWVLVGFGSSSLPAWNSQESLLMWAQWEMLQKVSLCSWCPTCQALGSWAEHYCVQRRVSAHHWRCLSDRLCSWPWQHVAWGILTAFLAEHQTENVPALDHTAYCSSRPPWLQCINLSAGNVINKVELL